MLGVGCTDTYASDYNSISEFLSKADKTASNRPSTMDASLTSWVLTLTYPDGNKVQATADWFQRKFYVRTKTGSTWNNWREIPQTELT